MYQSRYISPPRLFLLHYALNYPLNYAKARKVFRGVLSVAFFMQRQAVTPDATSFSNFGSRFSEPLSVRSRFRVHRKNVAINFLYTLRTQLLPLVGDSGIMGGGVLIAKAPRITLVVESLCTHASTRLWVVHVTSERRDRDWFADALGLLLGCHCRERKGFCFTAASILRYLLLTLDHRMFTGRFFWFHFFCDTLFHAKSMRILKIGREWLPILIGFFDCLFCCCGFHNNRIDIDFADSDFKLWHWGFSVKGTSTNFGSHRFNRICQKEKHGAMPTLRDNAS